MAPSTLSAHGAFFFDHAPTPEYASLLTRGPLLALLAGVVGALVVWTIASTCADPRRDRCMVRWLSEQVSGLLVALTELVPPIARIALGATLAWCAAIGAIGTPNLQVAEVDGLALRLVAFALAALLVLGRGTRTAAAAAISLFAMAALLGGTLQVFVERLDVVGLAMFVCIVGGRRLEPRIDEASLRTLRLGATWLRVLVASGLAVVAITEKLANVPMTAKILADHPHVDIGLVLGTDPRTTVLLLGAVEIAIAVLVLLLPLPELLALAIGAPFVLSVGEFGLLEVPGHLPVWGAVAVLALLGAHPQTSDLVTVRPPWMRDRVRTPHAARARVVGARVPWSEAPTMAITGSAVSHAVQVRRIHVGGSYTTSMHPERREAAIGSNLPPAPPLAPQVAAWLASPAEPTAMTPRSVIAEPVDPTRFQWAPRPGAGAAVDH